MTASFDWAGFASVVVSGLAPVLAALLSGRPERQRTGRGPATRAPAVGQTEPGVRVDVFGTQDVAITVHVGPGPARCVVCTRAKEGFRGRR